MQTDFESIWLFAGLSVFSGVSGFLKTTTASIRQRIWARVIKFLNKTCCTRLQLLPQETPNKSGLYFVIHDKQVLRTLTGLLSQNPSSELLLDWELNFYLIFSRVLFAFIGMIFLWRESGQSTGNDICLLMASLLPC